jgi:hypothetical protein
MVVNISVKADRLAGGFCTDWSKIWFISIHDAFTAHVSNLWVSRQQLWQVEISLGWTVEDSSKQFVSRLFYVERFN